MPVAFVEMELTSNRFAWTTLRQSLRSRVAFGGRVPAVPTHRPSEATEPAGMLDLPTPLCKPLWREIITLDGCFCDNILASLSLDDY